MCPSLLLLRRMRNVSDKSCGGNQKTHFVFNNFFFFFENRVVYEIMWKNIVESERPHVTIWPVRISRWVPKATNKRAEYVILVFPLQQLLQERDLMLSSICIACLVIIWSH